MSREYPERPYVGVGAIVFHPEDTAESARVLLVRRANAPLKGEWSLPGGLVDAGETLRKAAAREVKEETGLEVTPGEMVEVFERIVPDALWKTQFHYVLIDFLCTVQGGAECAAADDAMDVRWAAPAEFEELKLGRLTWEVIEKARAIALRREEASTPAAG
jgi:8-oxo-dGTP diphosphatase